MRPGAPEKGWIKVFVQVLSITRGGFEVFIDKGTTEKTK
jgi:hypothetical protein